MSLGKTTIFRQLIINIATPTLIVLLVFAGINFIRTRSILITATEEKNKLLYNEIVKIIEFQNISTDLVDAQLTSSFKGISSILVNKYFRNTSGIEKVDLKLIANEIGLDSKYEDIFIISSDGIIVNTTFKQDMGFNLFSLGDNMKKYLIDILKSGKFVPDQIAIEWYTMRPKKYTYQPTNDRKYIIELGGYSKQLDDILHATIDAREQLKNVTNGIIDIELFLMANEPFSLNKNYLRDESHQNIILKAFKDRDTISFLEHNGNRWYHYQYIYMEDKPKKDDISSIYRGSVVRIISDRTEQKALLRTEAIRFLILFLITFGLIGYVIYRRSKIITLPINKLVENVNRISGGDLRERAEIIGNNEITTLAVQFNSMVENIESQNKTLVEQKTEITDSITYAKYIQSAILPQKEFLDSSLKEYFILFKPRDIVSGDFYWTTNVENVTVVAAVDCTGHGVPGALMSMLGAAFLNEIVNKEYITQPAVILRRMRKEVIRFLHQRGEHGEQKDGMDVALCSIDYENMKLQFAGANNPIYLIRDCESTKLDFDNQMTNDNHILI